MHSRLRTCLPIRSGRAAVALCAASLFLTLLAPSTSPAADPPRTASSAVTPVDRNQGRHEQFLYRAKEGKIDLLFIGDSITDGWPRNGEWTWLKFAPYNPADFGVSGERTEDVLWRMTNGELDGLRPKAVVLMLGTNNIGQHQDEKPEWTIAGLEKLIGIIHEKLPSSRLLLLGIFPRGEKNDPLRAKIATINAALAKLDDGNKTRYLDIGHVFLDASGEIPKDVMPDLLHPSAKGYELWYDAMHPLLDQMMK